MEELRIYLDLVKELGDPFEAFERGWDRDEDPAPLKPAATNGYRSAPRHARSDSWFGEGGSTRG